MLDYLGVKQTAHELENVTSMLLDFFQEFQSWIIVNPWLIGVVALTKWWGVSIWGWHSTLFRKIMSEVKIGLSIVNVYGGLWGQNYTDLYAQHSVRSCAEKNTWKAAMYLQYTIPVFDDSIISPENVCFCLKIYPKNPVEGIPEPHVSKCLTSHGRSPPSCGNPLPWCPDDPWGSHRPPQRSHWWDPWAGGKPGQNAGRRGPQGTASDTPRIKNGGFRKWLEKPWFWGSIFRKPPFFLGSYIQLYFKGPDHTFHQTAQKSAGLPVPGSFFSGLTSASG